METISFECPYCSRVSNVPRSFAGKQGKCPGCLEMLEVPDPDAAPEPEPATAFELEPEQPTGSDAPTAVRVEADEVAAAAEAATLEPEQPADGDAPTAVRVESPDEDPPAAPEVVGTPVDDTGGIAAAVATPTADAAKVSALAGALERAARGEGADDSEPEPRRAPGPQKPCPYCGESIRKIAKKCRFCGEFLDKDLARSRRKGGGSRLPLASPGLRLGAWGIDFVMFHAPTWVPIIAGIYTLDKTRGSTGDLVGGSLITLGVVCGLFVTIYNWVLIALRGQTIGKRWLKLKIVLDTGKPVNFVNGVILRNWITGALSGPWLSWLGCLFFIIDGSMIFSQERRCLHDHIASTRVIELRPDAIEKLRSSKRRV